MFKQRCFDISSQKWSMEIETYSKLDSYRLFKQYLFLEDYLNVININIFRKTMSKFRVSNHNLRIESGRAENLTRERRICQMCHLNQVETELHFCLICPLYNDLRIKFLTPFFWEFPSIFKFSSLFKSKNPNTLINLSKFIFYALKKREEKSCCL